jgi:hypothetical protein
MGEDILCSITRFFYLNLLAAKTTKSLFIINYFYVPDSLLEIGHNNQIKVERVGEVGSGRWREAQQNGIKKCGGKWQWPEKR